MNQTSLNAHFIDLKPEGLLIVDSTLVDQIPTNRVVPIGFTEIARKEVGKEIVANVVALGTVGHLCKMVSLKSLEKALMARVPKGTEKMNRKAFHAGIKAAQKVDMDALPRLIFSGEEDE